MSRCVWALAPEEITEHLERTVEPDAKNWIFHLIETLNQKDLVRCFVTLWAIWFATRKVIHENIFQSPCGDPGLAVRNTLVPTPAIP